MEIMDDIELTELEELEKEKSFNKLYDLIYKIEMGKIKSKPKEGSK